MTEPDDFPTQPPAPTVIERGPVSLRGTKNVPADDATLAERIADAVRGHAGASIMLLDEPDVNGLAQVVVYGNTEEEVAAMVKDLKAS